MNKSLEMCVLAGLVYKQPKEVIQILASCCYSHIRWFDNENTKAFIAFNSRSNKLIICFRGTPQLNLKAIISYISTIHKKVTYNGSIHKRFYEAYKAVEKDMREYINNLPVNSDTSIMCTGHSLGAAIATIASRELGAVELYTFGSPRVGNKTYVEYLCDSNIMHYRYVNNNDIITVLPFAILGYRHFGDAIYFNNYGYVRNQSLWQTIKDRLRGIIRFLYKKEAYDSLFDHKLKKYIENLKKEC